MTKITRISVQAGVGLILVLLALPSAVLGQSIEKSIETAFGPIEVRFVGDGDGLIASVTNRTSATISHLRLKAEVIDEKGRVRTGFDPELLAYGLPPGGTKRALGLVVDSFKIRAGADARVSIKEMMVMADYRIEQPITSKDLTEYTLVAEVEPTGVKIEVANRTDAPIEIVWDECSFIDTSGRASRIIHEGVNYSDRAKAQPNAMIPPGARLIDRMVPTSNISFLEGSRYSAARWNTDALLPQLMSWQSAPTMLKTLPGTEFGIYIRLVINGKKSGESVRFRIAEASVVKKLNFFHE